MDKDHHHVAASHGNIQYYTEESGWTEYLQDFSNNVNGYEDDYGDQTSLCSCTFDDNSSWVSDAASCSAGKNNISSSNNINTNVLAAAPCYPIMDAMKFPKKLCGLKPKTKTFFDDNPLEDTASSPVNSPKVVDDFRPAREVYMNSRKRSDHMLNSTFLKERSAAGNLVQGEDHKMKAINFNGGNDEFGELKKRGLCVVPVSMIVNYFG